MTDQVELEEARLPLNQQPRRIERKCRKPFKETKRRSIGGITRSFALSTSCHGIPRLAASKTVHRRSLWTLVIIIVLSGYITHMSDLLRRYLEYPVRTRLIKETNGSLQFPAVTICNANKVRLSKLLQDSSYGATVSELLLKIKEEKGITDRRRRKRYRSELGEDYDESQYCRVDIGTDRRGSNLWDSDPTERVNSSAECCLLCRQTPGCVTWTYDKRGLVDLGNCWLSEVLIDSLQSDCCNSGVFDLKVNLTSTLAPEHPEENSQRCLVEQGTSIVDANATIREISTNTSAQCCAVCSDTSGCLAWTFHELGGACRLMNSRGRRKIANAGELSTNSTKDLKILNGTLDESNITSTCAIERNIDRIGFDLVNATDNRQISAENCCSACARTRGCLAWVFYKQPGYFGDCSLKYAIADGIPSQCCDSGILLGQSLTTPDTPTNIGPVLASDESVSPTQKSSRATSERTPSEEVTEVRTSAFQTDNPTTNAHRYTYSPFEGYDVNVEYDDDVDDDFLTDDYMFLRDMFYDVVHDEDVYVDFINGTVPLLLDNWESAETELQYLLKSLSEEEIVEYGHQGEDMVLQCEYNRMPCDTSGEFMTFQDQRYGNCYTFQSEWNETRQLLKSGSDNGLKLTLYADQEEYVGPVSKAAGFRVIVHAPLTMALPDQAGVNVQPGTSASLGISLVSTERMTAPYNECPQEDSLQLFTEYSYTLKACQKECMESFLADKCGCVDMVLDDFPKCYVTSSNLTQSICREFVYYLGRYNLLPCNCLPSCRENAYTMTISEHSWPSDNYMEYMMAELQGINPKLGELKDERRIRKNIARIEVYFEELNYVILKEEPAYPAAQLWANIGGSLGLWIGISVVTLVEVLEYFIDLVVHVKRRGIQCQLLPDDETTLRSPVRR